MDPNATLAALRNDITDLREADEFAGSDFHEIALRLAELAEALDEWITRGGFLPLHWAVAQEH